MNHIDAAGPSRKSRKVLVLISSLRGGGAERTLVNLLNRIGADAGQVELLIGIRGGVLEAELPETVKRNYLFHNRLLGRSCFWLFRKRVFRTPLRLVWKQRVQGKYQSVTNFLDSFLTDLVAEFDGAEKKVTVVHANCEADPNYNFASLSQTRRRKLIVNRYARLDTVAFVSRSARQAFANALSALPNFDTLPIFFSPAEIRRRAELPSKGEEVVGSDRESRNTRDIFQFICIGSLLPVKGHDLMLDACAILLKDGFAFHLHIVGDGPLREQLREKIRNLGLSDHMTLHGFVSNPYPLLANSDAMVMPSVSEAMPTVICEAHVLSIPVIASDCEGCRDLLDDGEFGVIFRRDPEALAETMRNFLSSPALLEEWRQKGQVWLNQYCETDVLAQYRELIGIGSEADDKNSVNLKGMPA